VIAKARAAASIAQAKTELDRALAEIDTIQTFNPALFGLVAQELNNYITVAAATIEMLQLTLRDYPDTDVPIWLDGIGRTTEMMQHSVSRLVSMSAPAEFPLKFDQVNLPVLLERVCEYHRSRPGAEGLHITCGAVGEVPLAWGDRVALAVVADNLLSHAVRASKLQGAITVRIMAKPGHVVCSVWDEGLGLTPEQHKHIFNERLPPSLPPDAVPDVDFGLSIANLFVRRMDGGLWCESEPGRGTRFWFRVPAVE
jgi:two-component system, sensor histidine kinase and response regulator